MSQKIKTSVEIDGSLSASQIANATTDTDKFLVSDGGTVKYRTGLEVLSDLGISFGTASKIQHQVKAGVAINKGQAVYVTGADGTNMIVGLASNASEGTSSKTMGLLNNTVAINGFADVITEGLLAGLNTIGATVGDPVWLGTGGNLIYGLVSKPYAPNHLVFIGIVTRVNANNGEIFVKVQNGFELEELHNVLLSNLQNKQLLTYNTSNSLWENKSIGTVLGGTSDQYVKGDGSFSSAMNSRIEVNFVATAGQTTFNTPYEVGQVDVYYNGSKLYPNEFTATDRYSIVLAVGASLNAQISIVKYVSTFSTTAIRNEAIFTTTSGQTTFSVNYAVGQVDVFYNGSKLNTSEFTATDGTSVVLGFTCASGESIAIISYVNQVSGASGTANKVAKFTGAASLGDSQIFDNGTYVGINNINPTEVLDVTGSINVSSAVRSSGEIMIRRSGNELRLGSGVSGDYTVFYGGGVERAKITNFGDVEIGGTATTALAKAYIRNTDTSFAIYSTNGGNTTKDFILQAGGSVGAPSVTLKAGGNLLVGTTTDSGYKLDVNGSSRVTSIQTGSAGVLHPTTSTGTNASPSYENLISYTSSSVGVSQILGSNYLGSSYGTGIQFRVNSEYYANDPITAVTIRGLGASAATGLGTSSPTSKLEVASGDIKLTDGFQIGWRYAPVDSNMYNWIGNSYDGGSTNSGINYRAGMWTSGDVIAHNFYTWYGGAWNQRLKISNAGYIYMPSVYSNTTGAGPNMYIAADGALVRSTSSLKYKKNVENYDKGINEIMQMRPVTYNSINENEDGIKYAGLIAEEIHDLGLTEFVQYAEDGTPDALSYANMVALLVKGIQELKAEIEILKNK